MALYSTQYANMYGIDSAKETYENVFSFGRKELGIVVPGVINSSTADAGASPTTLLRAGLVLGVITATGQWTNYLSTATDGSQNAQGVLLDTIRDVDLLSGSATTKICGILVGGPVQASKLNGLDLMARFGMFGRFVFDDDYLGNRFSWKKVTKAADYTVVPATDYNTHFFTATGGVTFTLPTTITDGARFRFTNTVDANMVISSTSKLLVDGNASATSVTYSTSSHKIGASVEVYADQAAGKWTVMALSPNAQTIA